MNTYPINNLSQKINENHTSKLACVYIRQSTMGQVRLNPESTERQYLLKKKAINLNWPEYRIKMFDQDLGKSGADTTKREDFKTLIAAVSLQEVGAIFVIEASRLSRSCADWHRLLELCALTSTLIIDEDGCYDLKNFNDQLILGIKGTMSQAELHYIRARLQGGKLNKAQKGELRFPLPVGLTYDQSKNIVLDPDEQVRHSIKFIFDSFRKHGTAYAVVRDFAQQDLSFPKRAYGGVWNGELIWTRLTHGRILNILRNPSYAGSYAYGRYTTTKSLDQEGQLSSKTYCKPIDEWTVLIKDHHDGYIDWNEYLANQTKLQNNQTNKKENLTPTAAREGLALLQGMLLCQQCGRRLSVRYKGNNGIYPTYECNWKHQQGYSSTSCMSIRSDTLDAPITSRILDAVKPNELEIALKAIDELELQQNNLKKQWELKEQRAEYEAQLAQKAYEQVDPNNRLVAANLESNWNQALKNLGDVNQQYQDHQKNAGLDIGAQEKKAIKRLVVDLPKIWKSKSTQNKDRKRILRLLIKDITIERLSKKEYTLHIRWQGGHIEHIQVETPPCVADQVRYPKPIIEKIRTLAKDYQKWEVIEILNKEGILSARGRLFTKSMLHWIYHKHNICSPKVNNPNEFTVKEVMYQFQASIHLVHYWIKQKIVSARQTAPKGPYWITIDSQTKIKLTNWIQRSEKLNKHKIHTQS